MLDLEFAQLSHPGKVREHNEDSFGFFAPKTGQEARTRGWLFALADGVGGHDHGEVASQLAVASVIAGFTESSEEDALTTALPKLVQAANAKVYEAAMSTGPGGSNMATTMVACALRYDRAIVVHAGDSRCYLVRQGYAASLTRDHTVSGEQMRMGLLTAREATVASTSHILSRSLGGHMFLNVETSEHQILANDVLVHCSDGLHHSLQPDDIARLTWGGARVEDAAQALIDLANARDGSDNISVQVIRVKAVERVGMYRGRHYKLH